MKKILEVRVGEHYINVNNCFQICEGIGSWSSKETSRKLITGPGLLFADWSAECPECRKVVSGSDPRIRPPIKEIFLRVKSVVKSLK